MNVRRPGLLLLLATLLWAQPSLAQPAAPEAKDDVTDAPAEAQPVWKVTLGKSPSRGPRDALVTLVVFSDFECPYCKRLAATFDDLAKRYPKELRFVSKQTPLPFHPNAGPAAELALEAFAQGKEKAFWQVHDALMATTDLGDASLDAIAGTAKLDVKRARAAIVNAKHRAIIEGDQDLAESVEATGTPTSFVNGIKVVGARPLEDFVAVVDTELARAKALRAKGTPADRIYETLTSKGKTADDEELTRRDVPEPPVTQPFRGLKNAPVTIHLFTDFQCPFCSRAQTSLTEIEQRYKGKVRVVYHSMPLSFHPHARDAAAFALEAQAQRGNNEFWKAHDLLFANQQKLTREDLTVHARTLGLDVAKLEAALADGRHNLAIDTDLELAAKLGVNGTPTFTVNGYELVGAQPVRAFRRVVERALREVKSERTRTRYRQKRRAPLAREEAQPPAFA